MSGTEAVRLNLEVMIIAVSDVDGAKGFYERLGWRLDDDVAPMDGLRIVQFTPHVRGPRSHSGKDSPPPHQARPRATSSSPTSRPPTPDSPTVEST
jgi:catechol 2,3-dioxygenase-like lactoylglutathione lyase family enzyme